MVILQFYFNRNCDLSLLPLVCSKFIQPFNIHPYNCLNLLLNIFQVRDRVDQYKGVGVNLNDPYENFRKSKGQAFITRMKARAEERI